MTLILSMVTRGFVSIVADRMLCKGDGIPTKRSAIKLVAFSNRLVFGYTGYADFPSSNGELVETSEWLAGVLANADCEDLAGALNAISYYAEQSLEAGLESGRIESIVNQEFLGVGWEKNNSSSEQDANPIVCRVTNCRNSSRRPTYPSRHFQVFTDRITFSPDNWGYGHFAGQAQSQAELETLQKNLTEIVATPPVLAERLLGAMVASIRRTSAELRDRFVGKDVLAAVIPKEAVSSEDITFADPNYGPAITIQNSTALQTRLPDPSTYMWFFRFPENRDRGIYEAPHIVSPGMKGYGIFSKGFKGDLSPNGEANVRAVFGSDGKPVALLSFNAKFRPRRKRRSNKRRRT